MHSGIAKRDFRIAEQGNRLILRGETVSVTDEYQHLIDPPEAAIVADTESDEPPKKATRKYKRKHTNEA